MLESTESLLPYPSQFGEKPTLKAVLVGLEAYPLDELERLLDTLGVKVAGRVIASQRKVSPSTYITQGKLEEVKAIITGEYTPPGENPRKTLAEKKAGMKAGEGDEEDSPAKRASRAAPKASEIDVVIIDHELSPNQLRNAEEYLGKPTVDRPAVILEIFSQHARTKESKTQVELAKLQYVLPRLAHLWSHFERQRGGGLNRGMGEKQIEVDRRLVKKRMQVLEERLKEIEKERKVQRAGRTEVLKVAIVGYTNAGKSTLLNALTHSEVLAENKLFATLDASIRMLSPDSHPPVVAVDTVGFVSRLPHDLVASFRSTLEEVLEADLLLHVVDASSPTARDELKVTDEVLEELGAKDKPRITVLNKVDLLMESANSEGNGDARPQSNPAAMRAARNKARLISPGAKLVSALNADDVKELREHVMSYFKDKLDVFEIVLPYSESKLEALVHQHGSVEKTKHLEKGTFLRVRMNESWAKKLGLDRFKT